MVGWSSFRLNIPMRCKFEIKTKTRAAAVHPSSICHQSVLPIGTKAAYFVYHLMVKTRRYYLRDMSMISPQSMLLFCGKVEDAEIEYGKREIVIDGWIRIHVASKCAVLILNLRQEISTFLMNKYLNPNSNDDEGKLTKLIINVLNEGSLSSDVDVMRAINKREKKIK